MKYRVRCDSLRDESVVVWSSADVEKAQLVSWLDGVKGMKTKLLLALVSLCFVHCLYFYSLL